MLANYPTNFPDMPNPANPVDGYLQHAPYTFRTFTNPTSGLLAYLDNVFAGPPPWVRGEVEVEWIVIHCLPGLYGPDSSIDPTLSDFDDFRASLGFLGSRFRFNGERFPIALRTGFQVQGTSALDTVFDARDTETAIFRAWNDSGCGEISVDSLTVRGARSDGESPFDPSNSIRNDSGAAFSIGRRVCRTGITISNCFIVENDVGIAIETEVIEGVPVSVVANPTIVNNTIAWNTIGIWSGNSNPGINQLPIAESRPFILNNIIDPGHPVLGVQQTFLGLHPDDLTHLAPTVPGVALNTFNAYPAGTENVGAGISNFPAAAAMLRAPAGAPLPTPRVDIGPYMPGPNPGDNRGILYVNDAFRVAGLQPGLSPHDFRLAPQVADDPDEVGGPLMDLNPLVNRGVSLSSASGITAIVFANGPVGGMTAAPGFHPQFPEPDRFHAWDWDCEGFGNPRVRAVAGFPDLNSGTDILDRIDLGADEMDQLIIAGYMPWTRLFARSLGGTVHTELFFFGLIGPPLPRPVHNVEVAAKYNWWEHTLFPNQAGPNLCEDCVTVLSAQLPSGFLPYASNYTDTVDATSVASYRSTLINFVGSPALVPPFVGTAQPVIMRNLTCDFSPALISDWHPRWGDTWFAVQFLTGGPDIYASNPWFGEPFWSTRPSSISPFVAPVDNWHLYRNEAVPTYQNHPNYPSRPVDGTLNPPGTWILGTPTSPPVIPESGSLASVGFLATPPTAFLGSFGCAPSFTYTVGPLGFGDALCPGEQLPIIFSDGRGVRYNCQVWEAPAPQERSNLQTFLVVISDVVSQEEDPTTGELRISPGGAAPTRQSQPYSGPRLPIADPSVERPSYEERMRRLTELGR